MSERKKLVIQQRKVTVSLNEGVIHIMGDDELKSLLGENLYANTRTLIKAIKQEYGKRFGKVLKISDKSLEVELWGHLLCELFFQDIYRLVPLGPVKRLYRFVKFHCTVIDSGEVGRDGNRGFWNMLVVGRKLVGWLLRWRLKKRSLSHQKG